MASIGLRPPSGSSKAKLAGLVEFSSASLVMTTPAASSSALDVAHILEGFERLCP